MGVNLELPLSELQALLGLADQTTHDLNNLLQPILGYADLLAAEMPPDDPRSAWANEIRKAAREARDRLAALREALRSKASRLGG